MLPAGPDWLDDGDKIASIVSAIVSLVSLVVIFRQGRRPQSLAGHPTALRRWRVIVASTCTIVATGAAALVAWGPDPFRPTSALVGGLAGFIALSVAGSGVVTWLRAPKRLHPALRRLLNAQLSEADHHQYTFGSMPLPGVSLIYVEQHLGGVEAKRTATRILNVDEFVTGSPKAIVIGAPGAGKSTLAAHIVGTAARWWTQARVMSRIGTSPFGGLIPVLLPAKVLSDRDVAEALVARWSQASVSAEMFMRAPHRRAKWLIIIDSLDEISGGEARTRVIQRLGSFVASTTRSHLIVTTRALTAGELADLTSRGVEEFHLRLFGPDELERFAANWFNIRGGGHVNASSEATRFLSHVRSSGLMSIVRVPLLATMAILVYENDRDRMLPTSRAGLYHEFTCLLRGAREIDVSTPFEAWLASNLDKLLCELASAHVRDYSVRLMPWAVAHVATLAPPELLTGTEAERLGALRNALIASGLCVFAPSPDGENEDPEPTRGDRPPYIGNDIQFVHFTIAEYLAADPSTYEFSRDEFRTLMANGRSRGHALFTLARSGADASEVVNWLLRRRDPLNAGRILADGIPVDPRFRQRTIDTLIDRVTEDHPTVVDCVEVLVDLATAQDVSSRLRALVTDVNQTLWARAVVADALADLDADGTSFLRALVQQPDATDSGAMWWARQRLAARVGSIPPPVATAHNEPNSRSLGEIGRQACIRTATDQRQPASARVQAAQILYEAGDQTGEHVLHRLVSSSTVAPDLRLQAALTLTASGDRQGLEALAALAQVDRHAVARVPIVIRIEATNELLAQGDPAGIESLRLLARDYELTSRERRQVVEQLVERDDPLGRDMLAELDRQQARRNRSIRFTGAVLAIAALMVAADGEFASWQPHAFIGIGIMLAAIALMMLGSTFRPDFTVFRTLRHLPAQPRTTSRGTTRQSDHLAESVYRHLSDILQSAVPGSAALKVSVAQKKPTEGPPTKLEQRELAQWLIRHPVRPVVILGLPGSGKTHLATTLALELLRTESLNRIPVLFSLRNWSASNRSLESWMIDRITSDYSMPASNVAELFAKNQIIPVLDGLDEVVGAQRKRAIQEIADMARRGTQCVVTGRTDEYEQLAQHGNTLDSAKVFEILPLQPQDVIEFILSNVTSDERKVAWAPVIRELEQAASGPFAELMTMPASVSIALRPYLVTGRDPGRLLREVHAYGPQSTAISGRVLSDYLARHLYALQDLGGYGSARSARWLRTVARRTEQPGTAEFNWWSVQDWFGSIALTAAAITAPPGVAAIVSLLVGGVQMSSIVASTGLVVGVLVMSSRTTDHRGAVERLRLSSLAATVASIAQTAIFSAGAALFGYAGTGEVRDSLVIAAAGAGFFWVTDAGQFQIARVHAALTGGLPWTVERFFAATARAGITAFDGIAYRLHPLIQEYYARDSVPRRGVDRVSSD